MSNRRHQLAEGILKGSQNVELATTPQYRTGWPTSARFDGIDGRVQVAIHAAKIGSHGRRSYEMRYQNPADEGGRQIKHSASIFPLLIGLYQDDGQAICVGADADKRLNNINRFSVLFNIGIIKTAQAVGWAEYLSRDDERIIAFHPSLLSVYVAYRKLNFDNSTQSIANALLASGFDPVGVTETHERGRAACTRLVRDWRFSRDVVKAYDGRCAITGMNWRIVQAAHILPVQVPGPKTLFRMAWHCRLAIMHCLTAIEYS